MGIIELALFCLLGVYIFGAVVALVVFKVVDKESSVDARQAGAFMWSVTLLYYWGMTDE